MLQPTPATIAPQRISADARRVRWKGGGLAGSHPLALAIKLVAAIWGFAIGANDEMTRRVKLASGHVQSQN